MPIPPLAVVRQSTASSLRNASGVLLAGAVVFAPVPALGAQAVRRAPAGFNLFSVEQDIEVGRQSAATIERVLRPVPAARSGRFLDHVVSVLSPPLAAKHRFQAKLVDSRDVTVFVLPDGTIYLSTGVLALARTEGELAGVLAHSMAHVVLRHGTARASRTYLGTAGLSALGGLGRGPAASRIIAATGGYGLEAAFLRFSPSDERDADALGTELLAKAGYDPVAMVTIFATARREARRLASVAQLSTRHPLSADREERIRALVSVLGHRGSTEVVGGYSAIRWLGQSSSRAMPVERVAAAGTVAPKTPVIAPDIPAPSTRFNSFTHPDELMAIEHPDNWHAFPSGFAISFAPSSGLVERNRHTPQLIQGVIVNFYAPFENDVDRWNHSLDRHYAPFTDRTRPRGLLEDATDDLVRQVLDASPYLTAPRGSARAEVVDGARGYSVRLAGRSPLTGEQERVTIHTRALPDGHVVYLACVTPAKSATSVEQACARMMQSLRVNDAAMHRH